MERDREALQSALVGYDLGPELGRGGWGIVYAAVHQRLNRDVAVKMLPRAFSADPDVRGRFEEEAQFAAQLGHPHVVAVYDFIETSGVLAIVMERMDARNLAERFEVEGTLQDTACALVVAVSSALHAAHRLGRVHRDVKPENVLFDRADVPKLSDFGVAKIIGIGDGLTRSGDVIGTPAYMSPEQATGQPVSASSDVYSTAVLAYELLSGRLPFPPADTAVAQLYQHVHATPIPLTDVNPDIAEPVARAVMRGLAKDPSRRYESAEAFAVAIGQAAGDVFGSGWLRDAGVEVRLTGRLVEAFRMGPRPTAPRRLPTLTNRAITGTHPRLGTLVDSTPAVHGADGNSRSDGRGIAEVAGYALRIDQPGDPSLEPAPSPDPRATIAPGAARHLRPGEAAPPPPPETPPTATPPPPRPPPATGETSGQPAPAASTGDQFPASPRRASKMVTVTPFTPRSRRRPTRGLALGFAVAILVVAAIAGAMMLSSNNNPAAAPSTDGPPDRTTATAGSPSSTTNDDPGVSSSPLDRDGVPIAAATLDGFEQSCRSLGLQGGADFCRCARSGLSGAVLTTEIDAAAAYFAGTSDVLPPAVRSVLERCMSG